MILPQTILKEFARATNDSKKTSSEKTVYGTYVVDGNGKPFVRIDGSDSPTPVANAMDAQSGDRVTVMVKNHQATVTGNLTCPASARSATSYMQFKDEGLVVGGLDDSGNPTGPYVVIGSTGYTVKNANGITLATFDGSGMILRDASNAVLASFASNLVKITTGAYQIVNSANQVLAEFSADKATIANGEGVMQVYNHILFLLGKVAVGVRSVFTSGNTHYYSEVVAQSDSTSPTASLQVRDDTSTPTVSSVIVSFNGVHITTPSGKGLYVNNNQVIQANQIVAVGSTVVSGTLNAHSRYTFSATISTVPSGYILTGLRSVNVTDSGGTTRTWFKLINFATNPSSSTVAATVFNSEDSKKAIKVTFDWFAIRNSGSTSTTPQYIDIGDVGD